MDQTCSDCMAVWFPVGQQRAPRPHSEHASGQRPSTREPPGALGVYERVMLALRRLLGTQPWNPVAMYTTLRSARDKQHACDHRAVVLQLVAYGCKLVIIISDEARRFQRASRDLAIRSAAVDRERRTDLELAAGNAANPIREYQLCTGQALCVSTVS